ncbi:MAG: hypothetical protein IKB16_15165 [Lentisphaeria bacterium]|nr:hypothetical protein [Lentisphaeria bacterium]
MKRDFYIILFAVLLLTTCGCISTQDLYGNWYFPQGHVDRRKIITKNYAVTFSASGRHNNKNCVTKAHYDVKNYKLFLRVKNTSGLVDNVFNIFGFVLRDHTRYWLGIIPIFGFQYSYKISDKEMLLYLQKYKFTRDQVMDKPILTNSGFVTDHSVPPLMNNIKE